MAVSTWFFVGCGYFSRRATAAIICPDMHQPHCGTCSSMNASWTGCSLPFVARLSTVRIVFPPISGSIGVMQLRVGCPSISTVQAPQIPAPQPKRVPTSPSSSRRNHSSLRPWSFFSTTYDWLLTFSFTRSVLGLCCCGFRRDAGTSVI